jgi:hypothetical protein
MISQATGKLIHHNDCRWCKHRYVYKGKKKGARKAHDVPKCMIHNHIIPVPGAGERYCELYQQLDCDCDACNNAKS